MRKYLLVNKKISFGLLALAAIIILIVALFTYYEEVQTVKNSNFRLSISAKYEEVMQGSSIQIPVNVIENKNSNLTVNLSATSNSTNLQYNIQPNSGKGNFTSTLIIDTSNSTPTNYYRINILATNGKVEQNAVYTVGVLNTKIALSGRITYPFYNSPIDVYPINLTLTDTSTGAMYNSTVNGGGGFELQGNYSMSIDNQHTYKAILYIQTVMLDPSPFGPPAISNGIMDFGTLTIDSPVGNSTLIHDFVNGVEK